MSVNRTEAIKAIAADAAAVAADINRAPAGDGQIRSLAISLLRLAIIAEDIDAEDEVARLSFDRRLRAMEDGDAGAKLIADAIGNLGAVFAGLAEQRTPAAMVAQLADLRERGAARELLAGLMADVQAATGAADRQDAALRNASSTVVDLAERLVDLGHGDEAIAILAAHSITLTGLGTDAPPPPAPDPDDFDLDTGCPAASCVKVAGHDGDHVDGRGFAFVVATPAPEVG